MKRLLLIFFALIMCGCMSIINNYYKPAPSLEEFWKKPGATAHDIRKASLECGAPSSYTTYKLYEALGVTNNSLEYMNILVAQGICMENKGFKPSSGYETSHETCAEKEWQLLPACQRNASIVIPSVERRLNSWQCKMERNYQYCKQHEYGAHNFRLYVCRENDLIAPECLTPKRSRHV